MKACALLVSFGVALLSGSLALAGPLDPPAGPIAPTGKTLTQVEPRIPLSDSTTPGDADSTFKITQPGSYYLTGNLQQIGSRNGIKIAASHVTIDLGGFTVSPTSNFIGGYGIIATGAGLTNITVRNGTVTSWAVNGIFLAGQSRGIVADNLAVRGNGGSGMQLGDGSIATRCVVQDNGGDGIVVGFASLVRDCNASFNAGWGVRSLSSAIFENCVVHFSGGGFYAGLRGTITNCLASVCGTGVQTDGMAVITGCSLSQNDTGINAGAKSQITDCLVVQSINGGIFAAAECTIRNNTVMSSGSPDSPASGGLVVSGSGSRIEGNHMEANFRGLVVNGAGNIILRNTCRANSTNWVIAANNQYGPIVDRSGAASPAVNGNAAASTLTSTDANANFTY